MQQLMSLEEIQIKRELRQFTGTQNYYKNFTGLVYTDGIKFLAEKMGAYWFIDLIGSYQYKLKESSFQIWGIKKTGETSGFAYMKEDSNTKNIITQDLSYTDMPFDYEVYVVDGVLMLKSEY